nr:MAG TPA: hypothetical protein [Caudoviricetes sp.]
MLKYIKQRDTWCKRKHTIQLEDTVLIVWKCWFESDSISNKFLNCFGEIARTQRN